MICLIVRVLHQYEISINRSALVEREKMMPSFRMPITLCINGTEQALVVEPRRTLLDALRHDLVLTGTKKVSTWATAAPARCWWMTGPCMPVCCLRWTVRGLPQITTIEGLIREGKLDPVQQAFIEGRCFSVWLLHLRPDYEPEGPPARDTNALRGADPAGCHWQSLSMWCLPKHPPGGASSCRRSR